MVTSKTKHIFGLIALTVSPMLCQAQLLKTEAAPARYQHNQSVAAVSDTLALPFWEDFSTTAGPFPDSARWQTESPVFVNTALAIRPPSLGVATFDGLTSQNRAYTNDPNLSGLADSLISQPIDLSGLTESKQQSTYLSFYWQLEGRGERPDAEDALNLYFLNADTNWVRVWRQLPDESITAGEFRQELLSVSSLASQQEASFFHEGFRFKWQSENRLSGQFDLWHLDYIYLDTLRSADDLYYADRTISEPVGSFLAPYTAMPMEQFQADPTAYLRDSLAFTAFSLRAPGTLEAVEFNEILYANGRLIDTLAFERLIQSPTDGLLRGQRYVSDSAIGLSNTAALELTALGDSLVLENLFFLTTEDDEQRFLRNDTVSVRTYLTDFFAYDDGTAEIGVGLNGPGQRVAIQFSLEEPDTLTHLQIAFPYYLRNPSGQTINLQLYNSLADAEGTVEDSLLYEQPGVIIPSQTNDLGFVEIPLTTPRVLPAGTYYLGFEQRSDGRLAIGFDRNTDATEFIFSSPDGLSWQQGFEEPGALQIRPRFAKVPDPAVLGVAEDAFPETIMYPNPARNWVKIRSRASRYALYNLQGKLCRTAEKALHSKAEVELSLEGLKPGMYLLRLSDGKQYSTRKLIIDY